MNIASLEEMRHFAESVAQKLKPQTLVLLKGEMGVGKTQFVRFLVSALGGEQMSSPSYAIHHSYPTAMAAVEHFDLFRLNDAEDLESTGFWEVFLNRRAIVLLEWAERLREFSLENRLPQEWHRIEIEITFIDGDPDNNQRVVSVSGI